MASQVGIIKFGLDVVLWYERAQDMTHMEVEKPQRIIKTQYVNPSEWNGGSI